ncbi:MAG: helix-turn-helix transcriptional regulator [Burkholderiales bacterium]|nr:helix-turn-helix transcriptional regulator [Burkholderiales bacterium]
MTPVPLKPDEMDAVFAALASEQRRRILDILKKEPGANVNRVCEFFDIGRVAVMKHLASLEHANLVVSEKAGRERRLWFNPVPIHMIYDRWTTEFSDYWAGRLARMKYTLENAPVPLAKAKGGVRG